MARVLVVDDELGIIDVLTRYLEKMGYQTFAASSGEEALDFLTQNSVEAVLLDVKMPGMGGLTVLSRIREDYSNLPVIMISGAADLEEAKAALKEGAADYIQKPFQFDYLEQTLAIHILQRSTGAD